MGFLTLDEMYLRQSLALAQQPPTPPMPSKIASGAMGAAKGMVKGLKARVSNAPSMVSQSGYVTTPPTQKIKGQKRKSISQGKGKGKGEEIREEGNSMGFSVNENEGWSRPTSAEAMYIMPPAERSKIGSHEVDKKRGSRRRKSLHAEKTKQNGEGVEDECGGKSGSESSVPGSADETSVGVISLLGHGEEGLKEEWCTAKERDSARHLSLELARECQTRAMLTSLPTAGTTTHTKARPPPIDVSFPTINGWEREEIEKGGLTPSLLPPPRPRRMTAPGQGNAQSTESSKGRSLPLLGGVVDERSTFFSISLDFHRQLLLILRTYLWSRRPLRRSRKTTFPSYLLTISTTPHMISPVVRATLSRNTANTQPNAKVILTLSYLIQPQSLPNPDHLRPTLPIPHSPRSLFHLHLFPSNQTRQQIKRGRKRNAGESC